MPLYKFSGKSVLHGDISCMEGCRAADVHKLLMRHGIKVIEDLFLQQRPLELHLAQSMVELM